MKYETPKLTALTPAINAIQEIKQGTAGECLRLAHPYRMKELARIKTGSK